MSFGKAKYLLPVFIACLLVFPGLQALAAEKSKPAATAGNVVKTKYFEIAIPKGWVMPKEIRSSKRATAAIFSNNKALIAVELSVLDSTKSAKEMAEITAKDMRRQKLSVSDPVEVANGFYAMDRRQWQAGDDYKHYGQGNRRGKRDFKSRKNITAEYVPIKCQVKAVF